jgi:hypothetical protein
MSRTSSSPHCTAQLVESQFERTIRIAVDSPGGPAGPAGPASPFSPGGPAGPGSPFAPCGPCPQPMSPMANVLAINAPYRRIALRHAPGPQAAWLARSITNANLLDASPMSLSPKVGLTSTARYCACPKLPRATARPPSQPLFGFARRKGPLTRPGRCRSPRSTPCGALSRLARSAGCRRGQ